MRILTTICSIALFFVLSSTTRAEVLNVTDRQPAKIYGYRVERTGLSPLYAQPLFVFGKTYFVRNDGSSNCNGLVNAPYPGSGTNQPCAFSSIQQAIGAATFGDTIMLHAGDTFDTPGDFNSFNLTNKGTPPTNTDADFITITTDDPSGTPAALLNYPHSDTRITTAMAARMPRVRTIGSLPVFWINKLAKYWRIRGLNITSVPGSNTIRLIGLGEDNPNGRAEFPDHIDIEQNWIRPPEEIGEPLNAGNIKRSAQNAIYLEGTNIRIRQNALQGFVGHDKDGGTLTSAGHLMTTWADNVLVENNLIEAWTYSVFYGGGSKNIADPNAVATVSNCTSLSCVFSNTNGLTVGKPVAVLVYTHTDSIGIFREVWGTAFVAPISGSTVNFQKPLCNSDNTGGNGNTCRPFDSNNLRQLPADGNQARWEGFQIQRVLVRRNILAHRPEWATQMGNNCGGKGYLELKSCNTCTFDANIFKGCTGPTVTTRNQGGPDPWNDLDNLVFSNNWFWNANSAFTAYLQDGGNLTERSRNVSFVNNLVVGEYADPNDFSYYRVISNNFSGGEGTRIIHNTVMVGRFRNFISYAPNTMLNLNISDNIFRVAPNQCFDFSTGEEQGMPITTCWPNASVNKNVLVNIDNMPSSDIGASWLNHYPNNSLTTLAGVGFVDAPPSLDASGNYRLRSDSPFKGKASDGKDPGADIDAMNAAIFGTSPPPLPSPTVAPTATPTPAPSASPTPTATPSPSPTATPTPVSSPTPLPLPSPLPTATPSGDLLLTGVTLFWDNTSFPFTTVVLADANGEQLKRFATENGTYQFTVRPGSYQIFVDQGAGQPGGYNTNPSKIVLTNISTSFTGLNFVLGPAENYPPGPIRFIAGEPLPLPSPSPSPSASPDPSPSPLPSPTPVPTPLPPCAMDVPASIVLPPNAIGQIGVTLNSLTFQAMPFTVFAVSSNPGQVSVFPASRDVPTISTSAVVSFSVRDKKRDALITFTSPCGSGSTNVLVR